MKTLVGKVVTAPFTINYVMTRARRHFTAGMKQRRTWVRGDIRVGCGVAVVVGQLTKRLSFKIAPAERFIGVKNEVFFGDVIDKLFAIIEVGAPGDIPGDFQFTRTYRCGRPISGRIPWRGAALPGFAVEATNVVRGAAFATYVVGEHAHK